LLNVKLVEIISEPSATRYTAFKAIRSNI